MAAGEHSSDAPVVSDSEITPTEAPKPEEKIASFDLTPKTKPAPAASGGGKGRSGGGAGGAGWESMLGQLRKNGLDIVICFDSTGSMGGSIAATKEQIRRVGNTLHELVPKSRIGICTYRDVGEAYVSIGLPMTKDISDVEKYLSGISAGGGGDFPEAVHEGLQWTLESNEFRRRARKVILLFGDAPPHTQHLETCKRLAEKFRKKQKGVVSTVTCNAPNPLREFIEIAEVGGGEAFTTRNEKELITQLMVLVFGSRYRNKVVKAFELMKK